MAIGLALTLSAASALGAAPAPPALMTYITGVAGPTPQVWVSLADGGAPLDLGQASSALLSPDGGAVAAVNIDKSKGVKSSTLSLYATTGGTPSVVFRSPQFIQLLAWSPDSKLILLVVGTSPAQLVVVAAAGGKRSTLASGVIEGASFAPGSSEQVVYARAALGRSSLNIYVTAAAGGRPRQLTSDGLSEYPLWGPGGIVYSHEIARKKNPYPELQLWLIAPNGGGAHQLTDMKNVPAAAEGLTAVAFSADGKHLLANFVGPQGSDETEAYVIDMATPKAPPRDLTGEGNGNIGEAISADGRWILATRGKADDFAALSVELIPWSGGKGTTLVGQGAYASWNLAHWSGQ